ncbi:MAG: PAS domain S-box protein [Desulfobacterales bacterium]
MKTNKHNNMTRFSNLDFDPMDVLFAINEGIVIIKKENIIYANSAFLNMADQNVSDISGKSFDAIISEEQRKKVMNYLKNTKDQYIEQEGIEFQFEKNKEKYFSMKVNSIYCRDAPAILGYISDITKRRKERFEIRRLHTRLRSILDHMRELVLSFSYLEEFDKSDIDDFSFFDDHLVEINSSALSFYEVPASYILNKKISIFDFIYHLDQDKVLAHYIELFEKGVAEITYRIITPTGKIKWVLDYGRVEYMTSGKVRRVNHIIEDITEKKKALDEIHASEEKYRRIFERSKDMIYILKPSGQIIDINPAGVKLLGLSSKEEAICRNMRDFHVDLEARDLLVKEILEKGEVTRPRMLFKNVQGEKFEIGLNVIAQRDDNGKVASYQGIVHNITDAIRQKELEAISQLAGCFADDLASPLSVVLIGTETVKTFLSDIQKLTEKLSDVKKSSDLKEFLYEIQFNVSDMNYFLTEVMIAVEDIKQRLKEIRDQYWNLKKVSDGSGGIIYQRGTKET